MTTSVASEVSHRLTFYVRDPIEVETHDVLRRNDGSLWSIVQVDKPMYRARWTAVKVSMKFISAVGGEPLRSP
jgi:hypothetical protein